LCATRVLCDCEGAGAGGGSDACDAESLVRCFKRGGREMLGLQSIWPGDALCF
jgi:hypothetical protein